MGTLDELIGKLWKDYAGINKQAGEIHKLLTEKGEIVVNDHVAFRTFNVPDMGIDALASNFTRFGYVAQGEYQFPAKKLFARHYEHPDGNHPKIFISELKTEEFSHKLRNAIHKLTIQVLPDVMKQPDLCVCGVQWKPINWDTYQILKEESEYAAWLAVFGFRANHFTVLFNALKGFNDLHALNEFIKNNGFSLNDSGGEIKGSPKEFLEQSSTMAYPVKVALSDGAREVPGCYYEFARRYPLADGSLFTGFVAQSADKIFESTDNK